MQKYEKTTKLESKIENLLSNDKIYNIATLIKILGKQINNDKS